MVRTFIDLIEFDDIRMVAFSEDLDLVEERLFRTDARLSSLLLLCDFHSKFFMGASVFGKKHLGEITLS